MKKIRIPGELGYLFAILILALAVAILTSANFGISMIVAPAYLLSVKVGVLSFGQAEYVVQACLFLIMCIVLRRFRPVYLMSFVTCLIYGRVLDFWRTLPFLNPNVTPVGSMALWVRILMYVAGIFLTALAIALFYNVYIYPQVYDFFVKAITQRYGIKLSIFKTAFDFTCLGVSLLMTFCFFGKLVGVNGGTLVMTVVNGTNISFFTKILGRYFEFPPLFPRFSKAFALEEE